MRISDWSSDVCSSDLITEYGLNPLEVTTDPEFGGVRRRINSFIAMINRTTSKLGVRQEAVLRALLNDLYELNGYDQRNPRTSSEEHTSELQSLMRTTYAVFCLNKKQHT